MGSARKIIPQSFLNSRSRALLPWLKALEAESAQEGLSRDATVEAYRTIYFPAQEIHFARDDPRGAATAIMNNDPRLAAR